MFTKAILYENIEIVRFLIENFEFDINSVIKEYTYRNEKIYTYI